MKKDLAKVKIRLIEFGYLDNEWLTKYLEIIEANLDTKRNRKSTQAHHAIPVNSYWTSSEPYKRTEALKLARADETNFEVHLLYKDHLIAHSYLTLCTNLDIVQLRYEAQADLRKQNSKIGFAAAIQKSTSTLSKSKKYKFRNSKRRERRELLKQKSLTNLRQFYSEEEIEDILNL